MTNTSPNQDTELANTGYIQSAIADALVHDYGCTAPEAKERAETLLASRIQTALEEFAASIRSKVINGSLPKGVDVTCAMLLTDAQKKRLNQLLQERKAKA
jgi:hypothetical protein